MDGEVGGSKKNTSSLCAKRRQRDRVDFKSYPRALIGWFVKLRHLADFGTIKLGQGKD